MEETSVADLFRPTENDQSIKILEQLFGGIIDFIHRGAELTDATGTVISDAASILNLVMLMVVMVLGMYGILSMTADTASDGVALGRSTDTKYTILRMGIGAILLLPLKGGFTLIQLIALYLVYMGIGLGGSAWTTFSEGYLRANSYTAERTISSDEAAHMRGEFGRSILAEIAGNLCMLHLNRAGNLHGPNAGVTPRTNEYDTISEHYLSSNRTVTRTFEMYFDTGAAARNSNDLCGKTEYSVSFDETASGELASSEAGTFRQQIHALARDTIYTDTRAVLSDIVRPGAAEIALKIYSGGDVVGSIGLRDNDVIGGEVAQLATNAANALYSSRNASGEFSNANLEGIRDSVLAATTEKGWMYAPLGQRKLSEMHTLLREYRGSLRFNVNADVRPLSLFQAATREHQNGVGRTTLDQALFDPITRDLGYLREFQPLLLALYEADQGQTTGGLGAGDGEAFANRVTQKTYSYARSWFDTSSETFEDPYVKYADVGYDLILLGGTLAGGASLLEGAASVFGVGDLAEAITGPITFVGKYLLVIGVIFMLIIPNISLVYFISAIISWLALVIEAMFALPIALAVWFLPAREPSLIGPWQKVVLSLFSLLLRPFFTVVGLIVCVAMLFVGNSLLNLLFSEVMIGGSPKSGLYNMIFILGMVGIYAYASIMIALHAASMITMLGDQALTWIGAFSSRFTENSMGAQMDARAQSATPLPTSANVGGFSQITRNAGTAVTRGGVGSAKKIKGLISK